MQKCITLMLLALSLLSLSVVRSQHIQGPIATQEEASRLPGAEGKIETKEKKTIKDSYNLIFDKYVTSLTALELVEKAAKGMQKILGRDGLSFIKTFKIDWAYISRLNYHKATGEHCP